MRVIAITLLIHFLVPGVISAKTYCSWWGLEPDKIASIWLISRFIDNEARFVFVEKGVKCEADTISFDTPDSNLRRSHARSTYENIFNYYQIEDSKLKYIGDLIHDIEINVWSEKRFKKTIVIESDLRNIIEKHGDLSVAIEETGLYLDELYAED